MLYIEKVHEKLNKNQLYVIPVCSRNKIFIESDGNILFELSNIDEHDVACS